MRVLHLYSGNLYGGIERMLVTLARERACAPDMEPHFALTFESQLARELRESGAPVHMLADGVRLSRPWTVFGARRHLEELLARENFDVVICHSVWPHAVFASLVRVTQIPLVHWAHDASDGKHWLHRRARRIPPDLVIANSEYTKTFVPNTFSDVPIEVVYCPVAAPPIAPEARREVRQELGTELDTAVIVMASRMEAWKGHRMLLAALEKLPKTLRWECWIAGAPQRAIERAYFDELCKLARELPVKFLGHRADLPRVFAAADIHCQPNLAPEPFGVVFVEALYAGLPVVSTRMGGAAEIIDSDCGVLVKPGDEIALVDALQQLVADPTRRARFSVNGPARARQLCDPAVTLPMLRAELRAVALRTPRPAGASA